MTDTNRELEELRAVQRECANAAQQLKGAERGFAILGLSDYLIEELMILGWHPEKEKSE